MDYALRVMSLQLPRPKNGFFRTLPRSRRCYRPWTALSLLPMTQEYAPWKLRAAPYLIIRGMHNGYYSVPFKDDAYCGFASYINRRAKRPCEC